MKHDAGMINLQGIAVNNGCWGNQIGTCGFGNDEVRLELEYQFGHSLFSQRKPTFKIHLRTRLSSVYPPCLATTSRTGLYKKIQAACDWPVPTPKDWKPPAACASARAEAQAQSGAGKWDVRRRLFLDWINSACRLATCVHALT